uniref:Amino acid transporter transmembrane domain-containing protein n=1 Tax=Glossina austeni TaxID=7395 RepID=A0A1A9VND7_GLOAU
MRVKVNIKMNNYSNVFLNSIIIADFPILLNCFKALFGCNVFLLPLCFKYSGLLWGSIQLIIFGLLFAYCAHTLLSCANFIAAREDISILSYGKLAHLAIRNGPPVLAEWDKALEVIFSSLIVCYAVYVFTDFKAEPEYFSYSVVGITFTMALATYVFEGINVILPFRNQVQNTIRFTRYVFAIIITITGLSLFVGIFGFIRFDYLVYPCITLHVPANTIAGQVVKCFAILSLLLTYPFQHNVTFVELSDWIRDIRVSQKYVRLSELLLQFVLIATSRAC